MNNNNQSIIQLESQTKGTSLNLPILIKQSIRRYEDKRLAQLDRSDAIYFDVYEELSTLLTLAPSTIRSYENRYTPHHPTFDKLLLMCKVMDDVKLWKQCVKFGNDLMGVES